MNFKFKINGIELAVHKEVDFKLDNFEVEITDLSLVEYADLLKQLPSILKEGRDLFKSMQGEELLTAVQFAEPIRGMCSEGMYDTQTEEHIDVEVDQKRATPVPETKEA